LAISEAFCSSAMIERPESSDAMLASGCLFDVGANGTRIFGLSGARVFMAYSLHSTDRLRDAVLRQIGVRQPAGPNPVGDQHDTRTSWAGTGRNRPLGSSKADNWRNSLLAVVDARFPLQYIYKCFACNFMASLDIRPASSGNP